MLPDLSAHPLIAAVLGGIFVGVGVGLIVRQGGSSGGDDALALTISHVSHWKLSRSYLFTDTVVLLLSLTYNAYCFQIDNRYCFFEINRLDKRI